jgi:spore germination cell wall hydrolase CwlJ-like protein
MFRDACRPHCGAFGALLLVLTGLLACSPGRGTAGEPDARDLRCLTLTLYWEGRGEPRDAMIAVGWVVLNRIRSPEFPNSVCAVVRQGGENPPCQFSFWCNGEPDTPHNESAWNDAQKIAATLLAAPPKDPTGGALYYHKTGMAVPWEVPRERTGAIGDHVFYR